MQTQLVKPGDLLGGKNHLAVTLGLLQGTALSSRTSVSSLNSMVLAPDSGASGRTKSTTEWPRLTNRPQIITRGVELEGNAFRVSFAVTSKNPDIVIDMMLTIPIVRAGSFDEAVRIACAELRQFMPALTDAAETPHPLEHGGSYH